MNYEFERIEALCNVLMNNNVKRFMELRIERDTRI